MVSWIMFHPAVQDLVKPQWLAVLAACKRSGGQTISEIGTATGTAYMTSKGYCEELAKRGYLNRTRLPRTSTGRPEIRYSLTSKADSLFFSPETSLSHGLLHEARSLFGDIAPERMLHGWYQKQADLWQPSLEKTADLGAKVALLATLRTRSGWLSSCEDNPLRLIDHHHPLQRIVETHPRVRTIEQRILENLLGAKVRTREIPAGRDSLPIVLHEIG